MPTALADPPARPAPRVAPRARAAPAAPDAAPLDADPPGHLVLHGVTWETYLTFCDDRENDGLRFTFDGTAETGVLEIEMPPEFRHENASRLLFQVVVTFLMHREIDWEPAGSVHVRRPRRRGGMPDESFYLAPASVAAMRGLRGGAGGGQPVAPAAPDLALEVVMGSPLSARKRAAFAEAGVREVWVWEEDVEGRETLTVLILADAADPADRTFVDAEHSALLPGFPLAAAANLLARRADLGAPGVVREFTASLAEPSPTEPPAA